MANFDGWYARWRAKRHAVVLNHYGEAYFAGKTVLEVGCGWGATGKFFHELGAIVTVSDAYEQHIEVAKERYPEINAMVVDSESEEWQYDVDVFDIVVHWGTLYHLQNPENSIKQMSEHCKELILETEVIDSEDPNLMRNRKENTDFNNKGWSQAFSGIGSQPSWAWVEDKLDRYGFTYEYPPEFSALNTDGHHYDWERKNDGGWKSGQRMFWFCKNRNLL